MAPGTIPHGEWYFVYFCLLVTGPEVFQEPESGLMAMEESIDRHEMVPHCGFDLHFPDNE